MFEMTPSVIDARSCVPFEPQMLEFSSTCHNFIELPIMSHKKKSKGERAADKTGQLRPIEEAINKMQFTIFNDNYGKFTL
jgi:hypothetical protein